ncbi:MAG: TolC family protein [Candidatus Palauibacterales bacterium]|nr:TolC family protein [Candidatus Palauibacterales bacterium]MDP2481671.1 TolC family protein [Candidatus Palauibacterales bacterium]
MNLLRLHTIALLLTLCVPASGRAQRPDTLRIADVVAEARRANPMLQAARYQADAAGERGSQAGALPDPMLSLGLRNRPLDGFGTDQMMTMNWIGLSQRFPWPGNQGFGAERQEHFARAAELDADEMEAALVARVKEAYFHLAFMDRALDIMASTRELLRDFLEVTSARYAVGAGLQQDILQAQVAIAQMTADITVVEQNRVAMAARLNSLLGRPATEPIGSLELPDPAGTVPAVDSLMTVAASNRPAIRAARERASAAEAGYRAAQRGAYPDFTVALGYGQRPQYEDLATIEVGISLPLWSGSKQKPKIREMQALQSSEEVREIDLHNETFARLSELRAAAERARDLSELYRTSIIPQAQAAVESALSAYRVGEVDYMTLLSNQTTVNRFDTERVRLAAEYQTSIAGIEALTGVETGIQ